MGTYNITPEAVAKMTELELQEAFGELKARRAGHIDVPYNGVLGGASSVGQTHSIREGVGAPRRPPRVYTLKEKMEMRMNWQPGRYATSFAFVEYRSVGDKAFMWILTNEGQSVVLEDEIALFPSDALITKVRMMGG